MDKTTLVEKQIQEGKLFVSELDKANLGIRAAFWLYDENDSSWKLYIASSSEKLNPEKDILDSYRILTEIMRSIPNLYQINPSDIVLISLDHPIIKNIGPLIQTGTEIVDITFSNTLLNNIYVEGMYLYRMNVP
ncbi:MAG: hypothetical protein WC222_07040 [Parachlamydiales bacterium]|jgi:hypothetical protein